MKQNRASKIFYSMPKAVILAVEVNYCIEAWLTHACTACGIKIDADYIQPALSLETFCTGSLPLLSFQTLSLLRALLC